MAALMPPTNEVVALAWLSQRVEGITEGQVATSLPSDVTKWADEGFVQVQAIPGGSPDIDTFQRRPVLQLDFWATTPGSNKPPWNEANNLAERVRIATEEGQSFGKPVVLHPRFSGARVQSAYLLTEPTRVTDDPSGYARFTADLMLHWVRNP